MVFSSFLPHAHITAKTTTLLSLLKMTIQNVLFWFVSRTVASRGAAAFVAPRTASQPELAMIGMSRDVYSQSNNFPNYENWGFWQNGRGGDQTIFDGTTERRRDSGERRNVGFDYETLGDYNDYYDGPDPDFGVREYQQQNRRQDFGQNLDGDFERQESGNFGRRSIDGRQGYYRDESRYPYDLNDEDDSRGQPQRYEDKNDYFGGSQKQRYGTQEQYRPEYFDQNFDGDFERQESSQGNFGKRRSIDGRQGYYRDESRYPYDLNDEDDSWGQPRRYGDKNDYFGGRERQLPWYDASQEREQEQYRPSEIVRDEPFGFGAVERMAGRMISPFAGFEMMDRMMNNMMILNSMMMDPFSGFGMMNQMMDRHSFEMEARMNQDQASIEGLVDDARDCIRADPAVANMLGDRIVLGMPIAQSSSSAIINGAKRTRLDLIIPVSGSLGEGRVRLLAEQGAISLLEVDVGGRVIDVRVDERMIYNSRNDRDDEIIDANVVDKVYR
jgi:hypothetical protein